jgi:CBS domain-containing protein/anti-sigma regulatory factor (Ser/Thr protein kinase)
MISEPPRNERIITDQAAHNITRVEELSYELRIREVMTRAPTTVTPDMPMKDVANLFERTRISGAPVVRNGELYGIVSIADLISALRQGDLASPVSKYMNTHPTTVRASDPLIEALKAFSRTGYGRFPALDENGKMVGIITKGDITRGVLKALQSDYQAEEIIRYRASHLFDDIVSDRTSLILRYQITPRDYTTGGHASSFIKRALLRLGAEPQLARRCGIAIYEAEMNLIIHTANGGALRVEIEPHKITMRAVDDGPGIPDIKLAMQAGFSTAPETAREMGFGAGMGLTNIQRCVDHVSLLSTPGKGTTLEMKINLPPEEGFQGNPPEGEKPS